MQILSSTLNAFHFWLHFCSNPLKLLPATKSQIIINKVSSSANHQNISLASSCQCHSWRWCKSPTVDGVIIEFVLGILWNIVEINKRLINSAYRNASLLRFVSVLYTPLHNNSIIISYKVVWWQNPRRGVIVWWYAIPLTPTIRSHPTRTGTAK